MALSEGAITVLVVSLVFLFLSYAALAARLWSRRMMKLKLAFDDYAIILAALFVTGLVIVYIITIAIAGLGRHNDTLTPHEQKLFAVLFIPKPLLWGASNTCVKLSIVFLYIRIFPSCVFRRFCYATLVITGCYLGTVLLEPFLPCTPVAFNWDKTIPGGYCSRNQNKLNAAVGIINLIIDAIVVILPMPMLWNLQMSLQKKLQVMGMFGLGAVICIISLQRVLWFKNWDLLDLSYTSVGGDYWSILEPSLGIVNACLPTMQPVLRKLFKNKYTSWNRSAISTADQRNLARNDRTVASIHASVDADRRHFHRLRDSQYPVVELQDPGWTVPEMEVREEFVQGLYPDALEEERRLKADGAGAGAGGIQVVTTWEVEARERSDEHV